MNSASFTQRFSAWLIDRAILFILYFLGSLLVGVVSAIVEVHGGSRKPRNLIG